MVNLGTKQKALQIILQEQGWLLVKYKLRTHQWRCFSSFWKGCLLSALFLFSNVICICNSLLLWLPFLVVFISLWFPKTLSFPVTRLYSNFITVGSNHWAHIYKLASQNYCGFRKTIVLLAQLASNYRHITALLCIHGTALSADRTNGSFDM